MFSIDFCDEVDNGNINVRDYLFDLVMGNEDDCCHGHCCDDDLEDDDDEDDDGDKDNHR